MSSSASCIHDKNSDPAGSRSKVACQRGVLLINLGTPDSPDVPSVRRYLAEFLSDPNVIRLPSGLGWLNGLLGRTIARFRAPRSAKLYERIWTEGGSPLGSITEEQVSLLEDALPDDWHVFFAMRYGRPTIAETLSEIEEAGIDELVVVPMYPHYSGTTTGTALRKLYGSLKRGNHRLNVTTRNTWFDDGGYIHAQAKLIQEYAMRHGLTPENTYLMFSAHGLPVSYVERGDPYPAHVKRSVELVTQRLGWPTDRSTLAFQSRFGPAEWLKPAADETLAELARAGEKRVLVCPISFTTDCLETLEELDVRYREGFERTGGELYLCPALNSSPEFITALKNMVLRGPRPVTSWGEKVRPLLKHEDALPPEPLNSESLVMIGLSLANQVGDGRGPEQVHADAANLHGAKRSQNEVPELLRAICEDGRVREAFVWNTCHRLEFYGWPTADAKDDEECIVARVREHLFDGCARDDLSVNVLCGADAWHHFVRTVAGLNSGLPGDRDILEQLLQAHNVAQRAGTAGPMTRKLIGDVLALERSLRAETEWGEFEPGYCFAALSRIFETTHLDPVDHRHLVVGGSTTSRSVLTTLIEQFDVPSRQLTLAYRGHSGGQIKLLRKAIGGGRRIRVQTYGEPQVLRAIADADVVFLGIDRDEPVLVAEDLRDLRDFVARPLMIIDFNTFGSTSDVESVPGVTLWTAENIDGAVAEFAQAMRETRKFTGALDAAEDWIVEHAPPWDAAASKPHRCLGVVGETSPNDPEVDPVPTTERWRRCSQCGVHRSERAAMVFERCAS